MKLKKFTKGLKRFQYIPGTPHKPYALIIPELVKWLWMNKGGINLYFDYEIYLRQHKITEFLTEKEFKKIGEEINSPYYYPILEDKYLFHQFLSCQGFPMPRTLYLADKNGLFSLEEKKHYPLNKLTEDTLDGFCKVINGFGGKKVFRFEITDRKLFLNGVETKIIDLPKIFGTEKYLIQERIIQHPLMDSLNPSCINTMRVITVRTGNEIHLYNASLRVGINGNIVDNNARGNIAVAIYQETGKLHKHALTHDLQHFRITRHPETGTQFEGFQIPLYQESIELVKSLHQLFPHFFVIGWDVGISAVGPIIIEGNNINDLVGVQMLHGGAKKSYLKYAQAHKEATGWQ